MGRASLIGKEAANPIYQMAINKYASNTFSNRGKE
jgi:hypothetical protein